MSIPNDKIIATDNGSERVPANNKAVFYYNWGPRAWIDMWMSKSRIRTTFTGNLLYRANKLESQLDQL